MSEYANCEKCGVTTYFNRGSEPSLCATCDRDEVERIAQEMVRIGTTGNLRQQRNAIVARAYLTLLPPKRKAGK